jgi:hypothetical protein
MCPYTWLSKDKEYRGVKMSREQIKTLIEDYAGLCKKYGVKPWSTCITPWRYSDPLVCPDLEYIFELADKHKLKVEMTTNGVSFTERNCKIIQKYLHTIDEIIISVIGFNEAEIKEFMGVSWKVTKARLIKVKENYPQISRKMNIGVKHKDQNKSTESRRHIAREIQQITLGKVKVKNNWMTNRMGAGDGVWQDHFDFKVDKNNFVQGCSMAVGKILRKMEILVDGTAVLCCEDATKKTNYGNVFELGIEKVWNNLLKEINLIYSKKYTKAKQNLICNDCSRAKGNWTNADQSDQDIRQKQIAERTGLPLEVVTH